ncbi:MAG TPA: diguanylate cyclase [Gammaproteobacteria bacterium]|nr:diguanylate cyclase [Gammaproteobacteria bacterium]
MTKARRRTSHDFPGSEIPAELRQAESNRPFPPELETEYLCARLYNNRTLIRAASTAALLLVVARTIDRLLDGALSPSLLVELGLVFAGSLVLMWLAWGSALERRYLRFAHVIVPIRNVITMAHFAAAAAQGQVALLMIMPAMMIGPFIFMWLKFRVALLSGVLGIASFVASAEAFGLAQPITLRASSLLVLSLTSAAITAWQLEKWLRRSFLQSRLIAELAQRDALTGMNNRRVFDDHLARIWQQAAQDRRPIAILIIDIDHFKAYNDRYGHLAGDDALRRAARCMQSLIHTPHDLMARYGGEEFAALLYDVDAAKAAELAERMRRAVMALGIEHLGSRNSRVMTVSIGGACIQPALARSCKGAVQLADQALYEAKLEGRNRVELVDDAQYQLLVTGIFRRPDVDKWLGGEQPRPKASSSAG